MPKRKCTGKFWPWVRELIWLKAQDLFQEDQGKNMGKDFTGNTAERNELREGGYFYSAKLIVLHDLWLKNKELSTSGEKKHANCGE